MVTDVEMAFENPYFFWCPWLNSTIQVKHSGKVPKLYAFVYVFRQSFIQPDDMWTAAATISGVHPHEVRELYKVQQKNRQMKGSWVRAVSGITSTLGNDGEEKKINLSKQELTAFGNACRVVGNKETRTIAGLASDAAASVEPVSVQHLNTQASVHNAMRPPGAPRRNASRTREMRVKNTTSDGDFIATRATMQDHRMRGRLQLVGEGMYDVECILHLSGIKADSAGWVEMRIRDLLAEHVDVEEVAV
jgi:hypothetical protein